GLRGGRERQWPSPAFRKTERDGRQSPAPLVHVRGMLRACRARTGRAGRAPSELLELSLGLVEQVLRQRRVVHLRGDLLTVPVDVGQEVLDRRRLRRVRIVLVRENPRRRR